MTLAEAMRCSQETAHALEMAARNDPFVSAMTSGIKLNTSAMPEGEVIARTVLALSLACTAMIEAEQKAEERLQAEWGEIPPPYAEAYGLLSCAARALRARAALAAGKKEDNA